MRIFVFSLFLCLNVFTSQSQTNPKTSDATLLVNGNECDHCSLELTRESLKKMILTTNNDRVKIASFKVKAPGSSTVFVKGHKLNRQALSVLRQANIGDFIQVFGISTKMGEIKTVIRVKLKG